MSSNKWITLLVLNVFLVVGCATPREEIYYWGAYEQLVQDAYIKPGSADPQTQIEKLNIDIQKSEALGKKTAPGIYAHLGFTHAMQGKDSQSQEALLEEQSLYPESSTFIDGMMTRAKKNEENQK